MITFVDARSSPLRLLINNSIDIPLSSQALIEHVFDNYKIYYKFLYETYINIWILKQYI